VDVPEPAARKDIPAKSFRETLEAARKEPKLPQFGFHDCRHHFISMCVMSGVDYMTIAEWVGHQDGGILICTKASRNFPAMESASREAFSCAVTIGNFNSGMPTLKGRHSNSLETV
jgi:hypothetical protein